MKLLNRLLLSLLALTFVLGAVACDDDDPTTPDVTNTNGAITIVNPGFETLYKSGSGSVTAPPLNQSESVSGPSSLGMSGPTVTFSDASTGNSFDLAGWVFSEQMGITNEDRNFASSHGNIAWFNGNSFGGGTGAKSMSQVLAVSAEQGKSYTLTCDFGWRNDNSDPTGPFIMNLYAGETQLQASVGVLRDLVKGEMVTQSSTFIVDDIGISGPLRIEIGLGPNVDGRQLNADNVTLTKADASGGGGGGGGASFAGAWNVSSSITSDTCEAGPDPDECLVATQNGNEVTIGGQTGTLLGNTLTLQENYEQEGAQASSTVQVTISSDGNSFTGTQTVQLSIPEIFSCETTYAITGTRVSGCRSTSGESMGVDLGSLLLQLQR